VRSTSVATWTEKSVVESPQFEWGLKRNFLEDK
jgi:hypothetical protein